MYGAKCEQDMIIYERIRRLEFFSYDFDEESFIEARLSLKYSIYWGNKQRQTYMKSNKKVSRFFSENDFERLIKIYLKFKITNFLKVMDNF